MMLTEEEIDKILIDTSCMDDVEVIKYVFQLGYEQAGKDCLYLEDLGLIIP